MVDMAHTFCWFPIVHKLVASKQVAFDKLTDFFKDHPAPKLQKPFTATEYCFMLQEDRYMRLSLFERHHEQLLLMAGADSIYGRK